LRSVDCFRSLLPPETTDNTQPVDAGLAKQLKNEIGHELEDWLDDDINLEKWETGKMSASEKRILITKFVGAAWETMFSREDFNPDVYFQKTGCLLTLDGSEDHLVNIQGLPNYKPPFQRMNDDSDDELPPPAAEPGSDLSDVNDYDLEVEENGDGEIPANFGHFNM
jgi:hypothetical protein